MKTIKKLPEAEFEIMRAVWKQTPPVSTHQITEHLDPQKHWKPQTILTLLKRLTDRGFLETEKQGKSRLYTPLISEQAYLSAETETFVQKFHQNSVTNLVSTLYAGDTMTQEDIDALRNWLNERT